MGLYHRSQAFSTTLGPQVSKQFSFSLAPLYYIMFYLVLILPYIVLDCSERITDLNIQKKHNSKLTLFISEHREREREKKNRVSQLWPATSNIHHTKSLIEPVSLIALSLLILWDSVSSGFSYFLRTVFFLLFSYTFLLFLRITSSILSLNVLFYTFPKILIIY